MRRNAREYKVSFSAGPWIAGLVLLVVSGWAALPMCDFASAAEEESEDRDLSTTGLNGLYGEVTPTELDTQFLADDLPESWNSWAKALDEELLEFFYPEERDIPGQRELIQQLRKRTATLNRAIHDPRYSSIHDRLISLAGPLKRQLDLATAALDSLEAGVVPVSKETREQVSQQLRESSHSLQAILLNRNGGEEWISFFGLSQLMEKLRSQQTPAEDLHKHLKEIQKRVNNKKELTAEQQRLLRSDACWPFLRAAAKMQAILEWEKEPATKETLRDALTLLIEAVWILEDHRLIEAEQQLQIQWDRVVLMNPKLQSSYDFLNREYYANNLHLFVSEKILQDLVNDRKTEAGTISDCILGSKVFGNQVTTSDVTFDLVPNPHEAQMAVRIAGNTNASTMGLKGHIKIYSLGESHFLAEKQSHFNGFRFEPRPATISVHTKANPYDAETPISCVPLLGSWLDEYVIEEAIKRGPEAEAMTRQKIVDRVVPEFNRKINTSLAEANKELTNNTYRRLANQNLYPTNMRTFSTETHLLTDSMIRNLSELGGSPPPTLFNEPQGVNYHIHESLLNNTADRMNFAGRTMTEAQVREELTRFTYELTGRVLNLEEPETPAPKEKTETETKEEESPDQFKFDPRTPVRFQVRNGQVIMTLRTGLIRSNGDEIPAHDIVIPFTLEFEGEELIIKKQELTVNKSDGKGNPAQNLVMRTQIGKSIPDGRRSRLMSVELQEGKTLNLRTQRIKALNGWLSLWAMPVKF